MPSHMHSKEDLDYHRGYTWWVLSEAKKRNPKLSMDGTAWSAPGWVGLPGGGFSVQATADYDVKWLQGLRDVFGLELDAIDCRNEKGALCVWRSNKQEQFVQQAEIQPVNGIFTLELDPDSIYSLSTTRGQRKGGFANIPEPAPFPFPYYDNFLINAIGAGVPEPTVALPGQSPIYSQR